MEEFYDLNIRGTMPERFYNQLNGKSAQENYIRYKKKQYKENESIIFGMIKDTLSVVVKVALDEIFKSKKPMQIDQSISLF